MSKEMIQQLHLPVATSYRRLSRGTGRRTLGVAAFEIVGVGPILVRGVVVLIVSPLAPFRLLLTHLDRL